MQRSHRVLLGLLGAVSLAGGAMAFDVAPPKVSVPETPRVPDAPRVNDTVNSSTDRVNRSVDRTTDRSVDRTTDGTRRDRDYQTTRTERKYSTEKKVESTPKRVMEDTGNKIKGIFK